MVVRAVTHLGDIVLPVRNTILPMACKMENLMEKESGCVHFYDYIGSFSMVPTPFALVSLEPDKNCY